VEKAQNLVWLAQTNPNKLGSLCNLLDLLSDRLWNGHTIDVGAFNLSMPVDQENLGKDQYWGP
jgi:hypothetical protein